jgi:hypothetical protein
MTVMVVAVMTIIANDFHSYKTITANDFHSYKTITANDFHSYALDMTNISLTCLRRPQIMHSQTPLKGYVLHLNTGTHHSTRWFC